MGQGIEIAVKGRRGGAHYGKEYTNNKGESRKEGRERGMETDDRDGWGAEKMDRGEVKKVGSDEVQRYREDNAHTGRERGKGKWADRD